MPLPRLSRTGLAALALAAVAALWLGWRAWQGTPVDVASATATRLKQTVVVSGRVLTPAKVEIGATITGRVAGVKVDDGDPVQTDQVLVELERSELAAALAQAAATEQAAATRIAQWRDVGAPQVREQLVQAEATYRNVERDAARQEQLFRQGFIGEARVDEARRALTVAKSQLETARASAAANTASGVDRRLLEDQLAQARAARETAAAKLAQTTLRAPAAGVVLDRSVEPGDIVQPGKRLLTLALAGATRLTALIDEKNLGLLKVGQVAVVSADAYPADRFRAELAYVAPGIDVQRGTVEAKFTVPAPPPYLRADMTVSIEIEVADRADAVVVPAAAVRDAQTDAPWVLVVDGGRARRVPVKLGARTASQIEIREGAAPGAQVILTSGVAAGERVRAVR
jgi:HlyD family secretion protein